MTITFDLPPELAAFVQTEVASGAAADEAELLTKAVQVYRDLRTRRAASVDETDPSPRLPDPPWLDECVPAPFDLPRAASTRVYPRQVAERMPPPFDWKEQENG
jgi:Arc/MetJ-type ribon-helix-helix transcriptional regulator